MNRVSILLVEDHEVFAKALLRVLSSNSKLNVVTVLNSGEKALEALPNLEIDLVLADVSLPNMSGIQLVEQIVSKHPSVRCAVLSGHMTPEYVRRALDSGARGYMIKDNPAGILEGINAIMNGNIYVSAEISAEMPDLFKQYPTQFGNPPSESTT